MSALTTKQIESTEIDFGVADEVVAGLRGRLVGITADTPAGYEQVKAGIAEVRSIRTGVEKARKQLKSSALEYGRKVDAEAKRVTNMLLEIEQPLKLAKEEVDTKIERERREREMAALAKVEAEKAKAKAAMEAREREERERIAAEQKAEADKLAAERAALEKQQAEIRQQQQEAEAKLAAERAELEAAKAKMEAMAAAEERKKLDAERKRKEAAEAKVRAKAEAERAAKEQAEVAARRKEAERIMLERRPDAAKLADTAGLVKAYAKACATKLSWSTDWGPAVMQEFIEDIVEVCDRLVQEDGPR